MSTTVQQETSVPTRRFTLWHLSIVLLVIGLLVTGYLSYEHADRSKVSSAWAAAPPSTATP